MMSEESIFTIETINETAQCPFCLTMNLPKEDRECEHLRSFQDRGAIHEFVFEDMNHG